MAKLTEKEKKEIANGVKRTAEKLGFFENKKKGKNK